MSVDYGVYFNAPVSVGDLSKKLAVLFGVDFEVEDEGDFTRCMGDCGPLSIACWAPHGMENDLGIPFERFDTVINIGGADGLEPDIARLAQKAHDWTLSEYDASALLVRDVQTIISRDDRQA